MKQAGCDLKTTSDDGAINLFYMQLIVWKKTKREVLQLQLAWEVMWAWLFELIMHDMFF